MSTEIRNSEFISKSKAKFGNKFTYNKTLYIRNTEKVYIHCEKHGEIFITPKVHLKSRTGCQECSREIHQTVNSFSIEQVKNYLNQIGASLISSSYNNNRTKIICRCSKGHETQTTFKHIKKYSSKGKEWCTECSGKYKYVYVTELMKFLEQKMGVLETHKPKFKVSEKVKVRCHNNHSWSVSVHNLIENNSWCPKCYSHTGEQILRQIFEKFTGLEFPTRRPNWLIGNNNRALEIDGYNEELNLGFEHQGRQHFDYQSSLFKSDEIILRDKLKRNLLEKSNVNMLYVDEIPTLTSISEAISFTKSFLLKNKVKLIKSKLDESDIEFAGDLRLFEINEIAKKRGGKCISKAYLGHVTPLEFVCNHNHVWLARPNDIKRGSWCSRCSGSGGTKKDLSFLKMIAKKNSLECLSEQYINSKHKYLWKCICGNVFEKRYDQKLNCSLCDTRTN